MSDSVLVTLIITIAFVVVLYIFRDQLKSFFIKVTRRGIQAELTTHPPDAQPALNQPPPRPGVEISGNVMKGQRHTIKASRDASVRENLMEGRDHEIDAGE